MIIILNLFPAVCHGGVYQRKLYRDLMVNYNRLERPVQNDSAPIVVELGLTLLQIIDVVSLYVFCEVQRMSEDSWKMCVELVLEFNTEDEGFFLRQVVQQHTACN